MTDLELAELSNAAYEDETFSFESQEVLVQSSSNAVVFAFRGTEGYRDWATNFKWQQACVGKTKVHAGFLAEAYGCYVNASKFLSDNRGKKVYLTGHSKGGAVAQLFATYISQLGPQVVTFAAPRVGDCVFSDHFRRTIPLSWNYVNQNDIVPRLPSKIRNLLGAQWCNCGDQKYIDRNGGVHTNPPWWFKSWDRLCGISNGGWSSEHSIDQYIAALQ